LEHPIPVTVVTQAPVGATAGDGTAVIRMVPGRHHHAPGTECMACVARNDIRALLYDLLQSSRLGHRPQFSRVLIRHRSSTG
jgi:hypothetical protein